MFTVRLDQAAKKKLDELARSTGRSRSEIVRDAIRAYDPVQVPGAERTVFDQLGDIVGIGSLGGNRARDGEAILRAAFARKRHAS
jgi:Arc/MetJ-type ribon-helix-helix transcriptional regulator